MYCNPVVLHDTLLGGISHFQAFIFIWGAGCLVWTPHRGTSVACENDITQRQTINILCENIISPYWSLLFIPMKIALLVDAVVSRYTHQISLTSLHS